MLPPVSVDSAKYGRGDSDRQLVTDHHISGDDLVYMQVSAIATYKISIMAMFQD